MAGVEVGVGYFSLVPSLKGSKQKITKELGGDDIGDKVGDQAGDAFDSSFASKMKGAGLAAGVALGAVLAKGLSDALGRGAAADVLAAQLNLSPAESERYGKVAGSLYAAGYGDSIEGAHGALGLTLKSLGRDLTDSEALGLAKGQINLTDAFKVDGEKLAQTTGLLVKNGLVASAREGQDVLTAAFQDLSAPAADVLDTLYEFSEPLASLGFDGAKALDVFARGGEAGVFDLTKLGDAAKEVSIRAIDGSTATQAAYKQLGLDAELTAQAIAGGGPAAQKALGNVLDSLQSLEDPLAQEAAGVALFGATFEDLGPAAIQALNPMGAAIADVTGRTDALDKILNDNLRADLEILKRQGLQAVADVLEYAVVPALQTMVGWVKSASTFIRENDTAAIGLAAGLGVVTAVLGVQALSAGVAAASNFLLASSFVAAALPVLAAAAAVGVLVAGVVWAYDNVEIFRNTVDTAAAFLTGTVWPAISRGVTWFKDLAVAIKDHAIKWFEKLHEWPGNVKTALSNAVEDMKTKFDGFVTFLTELPGRAKDAVVGIFDGIADEGKRIFNLVAGYWNSSVGSLGFTFPEWVPNLGGKSVSVPNIPILHNGGIVPGRTGEEVLILAQAGEGVIDLDTMRNGRQASSGSGVTFTGPMYVQDPDEFVRVVHRKLRAVS